MTTKDNSENTPDCTTAGKGFARTEDMPIASESCGLPSSRGFASTEVKQEAEAAPVDSSTLDCSTAGMGFARTDQTKIAPDNCAFPSKGFGTTDFGDKK